ncbi:hypothetical protein GOP47_0012795 [Adiantum capillus-veneris]|uniref:Uncharacterized protein n=1 Tax=Adiantum capillus-veneris TaxID=13818 RepID=A0A9D4URT1_ADICA|nr:hypothetical protein GOP47_0012795 [Adiantum capillus-veneris]
MDRACDMCTSPFWYRSSLLMVICNQDMKYGVNGLRVGSNYALLPTPSTCTFRPQKVHPRRKVRALFRLLPAILIKKSLRKEADWSPKELPEHGRGGRPEHLRSYLGVTQLANKALVEDGLHQV